MLNLQQLGFFRGVNLGGWFSQCDYHTEHLDNFITQNDMEVISSWGADHVRLPVDYNIFQRKDGLDRVRNAVSMALRSGLHVVLDLHKTEGFSFDDYAESEHGFFENELYQEKFYQIWEMLAEAFSGQPVAFELLNEITDETFLPEWNRIAGIAIQHVRKFAPENLILVGSYNNNSAETVQYLDLPEDEHLLYNLHCYEPLKFTHQGAYWTNAIDPEKRISFAESETSAEYFEQLFSSAIEKAKQNHTVLYCGEYGVIDKVSPEDTLQWFNTIHQVFEQFHIAHCVWTYKGLDFGLTDTRLDSVRKEIFAKF